MSRYRVEGSGTPGPDGRGLLFCLFQVAHHSWEDCILPAWADPPASRFPEPNFLIPSEFPKYVHTCRPWPAWTCSASCLAPSSLIRRLRWLPEAQFNLLRLSSKKYHWGHRRLLTLVLRKELRLPVLSIVNRCSWLKMRLLRATEFKSEQTDRTWMFCQIR